MEIFPAFGILSLGVGEQIGESSEKGFRRSDATASLFIGEGGDGTKGFESFGTPAGTGKGVWRCWLMGGYDGGISVKSPGRETRKNHRS